MNYTNWRIGKVTRFWQINALSKWIFGEVTCPNDASVTKWRLPMWFVSYTRQLFLTSLRNVWKCSIFLYGETLGISLVGKKVFSPTVLKLLWNTCSLQLQNTARIMAHCLMFSARWPELFWNTSESSSRKDGTSSQFGRPGKIARRVNVGSSRSLKASGAF